MPTPRARPLIEMMFSVTPEKYISTKAVTTLTTMLAPTMTVGFQSFRKNRRMRMASRPPVTRLETMVLMGMDMPVSAIRAQISSAIDIIVHLARLRDKSRKVVQIAEVGDCINGEIVLTPLFKFVENSQDKHGKVIGTLVRQNNVFNRTEKLKAAGFSEW